MEDAYTYYVLLLGIPEELFWDADISFLLGVVENKAAYDGWSNYVARRKREKAKREAQRRRKH